MSPAFDSLYAHVHVDDHEGFVREQHEEIDDIRFGEKYIWLGRNRIISTKKVYTFIGPSEDKAHTTTALIQYFVPGFVFIWATGYGAVFLAEIQGEGLGDTGGVIGVGFTVFLLLALFGAAAYETFKPDANNTAS